MRRSTVISFIISVLAFGVLVPWWKGFDFFDPLNVLACMSVSLVFVAPVVADTAEGESDRARMVRAVTFAWVIAVMVILNGIVIVNVTNWFGHVLTPSVAILTGGLLFNFLGGTFIATQTVLITRRFGAHTAKLALRLGFFVLLGAFVYLMRFASEDVRTSFNRQLTTEGLKKILLWICGALLLADIVLVWRVRRGILLPSLSRNLNIGA